MPRLTSSQYDDLQLIVDDARRRLAQTGLTLTAESDFAARASFMRCAPGMAVVSTTFDPDHAHLHPGNAFWIAIREGDSDGTIVGCNCLRLFVTPDFLDEIRSHRLFFDRVPVIEHRTMRLTTPADEPPLSGRIVYTGGLWVAPSHRGGELSTLLPTLGRVFGLRHFALDWYAGFTSDTAGRQALARDRFRSATSLPCIDGWFPPRAADAAYRLNVTSRWSILDRIAREADALRSSAASAGGNKTGMAEEQAAFLPAAWLPPLTVARVSRAGTAPSDAWPGSRP